MVGTRRTTARVMVILLGILASLLAPAAARAVAETPFRADFTGQAMFTPTSTPGVFVNTFAGEGLASHLGRVEVSVTEIIDLTSPSGAVVQRDGRMTMIAANGDALRWSYSGAGTSPDAGGDLTFSGLAFLRHWAIPNFFFHVTTTYNLLRHNGVELGKADFLGRVQN